MDPKQANKFASYVNNADELPDKWVIAKSPPVKTVSSGHGITPQYSDDPLNPFAQQSYSAGNTSSLSVRNTPALFETQTSQGSRGQELGSQGVQLNNPWFPASRARLKEAGGDKSGDAWESLDKDSFEGGSKHLFACPFYKLNPHYYQSCRQFKPRSISDIRQHLTRRHQQPLHCANCKRIFEGRRGDNLRRQYDLHLRTFNCVERETTVPGITERMVEQIREQIRTSTWRRNTARASAVENWFELWRIVCPGTKEPESPYLGDSEYEERVQYAFKAMREPGFLDNLRGTDNHTIIDLIEQSLTRILNDAPLTDSGYASAPSLKLTTSQLPTHKEKATGQRETTKSEEDDDDKTTYSTTTTSIPNFARKVISEICQDIHARIETCISDKNWMSTSNTLPALVKAFAFKLNSGTSGCLNRQIMFFVHRHHQ